MSNLELKVEKKVDEKKLEGLVNAKEITENKIEKSLNYDELSKEEKEAIDEFNKKIDLTDSAQILQYGVAAQEKRKSYDWTRVINAIIQVESKGNAKAVSKDCVGVMQIRPLLVRDVNEYLKIKGSSKRYTLNDRFSPEKSKEMFILYQKRYNPTNNEEKAIRLWNGGSKYSVAKTEWYYRKVLSHMKWEKCYEIL